MKNYIEATKLPGLPGMAETLSGVHRWAKRNNVPRDFINGRGQGGSVIYHISSLPVETQRALKERFLAELKEVSRSENPSQAAEEIAQDPNIQGAAYADAKNYAKRKADKYLNIIGLSAHLKGNDLEAWVEEWNRDNPNMKTSYPAVLRARKTFKQDGAAGLLGKWGNRAGETSVVERYYEFFRDHYLQEARPSIDSVWRMTLGYAIKQDNSVSISNFPAQITFVRLLEKRIAADVIYRARYGFMAWNRKYADYIARDYSQLIAGECWVSDHAQIDVLVSDGSKVKAPWLTAWMDAKTGKFLAWNLHLEPPSSDYIFEAFYLAASKFGLPKRVLIDNGKDYRCKDFAGGRSFETRHKLSVNENRAVPMLTALGVNPHFALPYNAQAKPIERQFCKFKGWFSKRFSTFRGGNVVERPENLSEKIKAGQIVDFGDLKASLDGFIEDMFNNMPSTGKVLKGKTPNQAWAEEFRVKNEVRKDALKLFCMRSSQTVSIGRNGIKDSKYEVQYYNEWMSGYKGTKVYFRRPSDEVGTVWVFDASDDSYLGEASLISNVPFFAETEADRALLKAEIARKNRDKKRTAQHIRELEQETYEQQLVYLKTGTDAIADTSIKSDDKPISRVSNTQMDGVVLQIHRNKERESYSIEGLKPQKQTKPTPIFAFEVDKRAYEKTLKGDNEE